MQNKTISLRICITFYKANETMASLQKAPMSENEEMLIKAVKGKNSCDIKKYLSADDVKVDCLDENGMSPLQHAAYYGE